MGDIYGLQLDMKIFNAFELQQTILVWKRVIKKIIEV